MAADAPPGPGPDMFEEIVMAEHRFHGEGYQEGYAEGRHAGAAEGRRHGARHGARVGAEIGSYLGFALTWQCLLRKCTDEKNRFDLFERIATMLSAVLTCILVNFFIAFLYFTQSSNCKKRKALDSLIGMIQKFPYEDPTYEKLQEDLEKIRGKFKQALQIMETLKTC